ncbi:hypothetical protein LCGC14_1945950 [marine sediment metagenome]|uniref:Uncharacterized protein n=1 Tax=marine sediment metagenome TaxID=412755 RepID=A0A0F9IG22_9ZZZZ
MSTTEIGFLKGHRKDAIKEAIKMVKKSGRSAEVIACRDIPGEHTAGEDCFCDPRIFEYFPEDL